MMQVIPPHPTATKARGWISGSPCLTDTANMALVMVEMSVDMIDNVPRKCLTLVFGIMNCRGLYKQSLDDGRTIQIVNLDNSAAAEPSDQLLN